MSFVDQSAEALGQADDRDPAIRLGEAAQQSLQEPSPECVDILDTRHVEVDARDRCALRHGAVDEMFQFSGVLRRPRTDRRQPQAVALGQAPKKGSPVKLCDMPRPWRCSAPACPARATDGRRFPTTILSSARVIVHNW